MLIALDLALAVVASFGIVFVTAADQPSNTQAVIAWLLFAVLISLAAALLGLVVVGIRRLMALEAGHTR
jgi:drug/metabolite transporter (DMT)-like permease